ncbi:hypothetical protein MBM_09239 [Drepanopeziza brunnea f. sp. 'multigermtubi' MB_m1]|uniref:Uncharacterized protein n=1 Tax=Marssonina brunnea f. sp. multigermtubi (strain MB_m1) TaxID=1072389 RepID=K1W6R5_MARBU|nr:uncharacterized protein MBM_09239 [Drepanopeziza brunnea f. sp. 'multigermtubi' MB_m1]EKD12670.1 hypothetical protein MBM_09239 [Drepanopeziza brunnea f. sp. 'multigermtubi' MB_m1]
MLSSKSTCAILLALSFLSNRAQGFLESEGQEIIGYRTVFREEAEFINFVHRPYRDDEYDNDDMNINELGHGFYMTNEPAGWQKHPIKDNWFCVIRMDSKTIADAAKIYIPESYQKPTWFGGTELTNLWSGNEKVILEYIKSMISTDPKEALRFSWIPETDKQQMVIPTDYLNNDALDIWAHCYETKEELYKYSSKTIAWDNWKITGSPGSPSSHSSSS